MCHWDECMNANNILFSFFLPCLYFYSLLSSLVNSFIMKKKVLFGKKITSPLQALVLCFQGYVTENLYSIFRYILYVCE